MREILLKILDIHPGPVAVQVTSLDPQKMVEEGLRIFEFSPRIIVKIPMNRNGLLALKELNNCHVPVIGTAVISPYQVLLSSIHNPSFIAPYFSHIGNTDEAWSTLRKMMLILKNAHSETKILLAS